LEQKEETVQEESTDGDENVEIQDEIQDAENVEEPPAVVEDRDGEKEMNEAVDDVEKESADVGMEKETSEAPAVDDVPATAPPPAALEQTGP